MMTIIDPKKKNSHQLEWKRICAEEQKLLSKRMVRRDSKLGLILEGHIPAKLSVTLNNAFATAFMLVFEKGTDIIEKTYNKEQSKRLYKSYMIRDVVRGDENALRNFTRNAERTGYINLFVSGASGVGMGLFGAGIPDIPLLTGLILKCIYEIALNYGFEYETPEEKYLILMLIEGAIVSGSQLKSVDNRIEAFLRKPVIPEGRSLSQQMHDTSSALAEELLYTKFIQGIPIIGVAGGACNFKYMKQVSDYASIKYEKRYLLHHKVRKK